MLPPSQPTIPSDGTAHLVMAVDGLMALVRSARTQPAGAGQEARALHILRADRLAGELAAYRDHVDGVASLPFDHAGRLAAATELALNLAQSSLDIARWVGPLDAAEGLMDQAKDTGLGCLIFANQAMASGQTAADQDEYRTSIQNLRRRLQKLDDDRW